MKKATASEKVPGVASTNLSASMQESPYSIAQKIPSTSVFVSCLTQESHFQRGLFVSVLVDSPYAFAPYEIRLPLQETDEVEDESNKAIAHALSRITLKENPYKVFYSLPTEPDLEAIDTSGFASIEFEAIDARDNASYPALRQFLRKHGTY